ncbi:neurotransmitter:Na+ symporter, NSS family [Natronorubrum sediminis]|uniref:Neurotransmitter:Na+ symporter, NSS family n=1 Tax=Natronorubrum sediminis TaxID=640943 RepID=A0A1H6FJ93_9EURY|nr:sodium-dependent transporter [Natronorubrum sediminis]SEH10929.1 neurotransmitter:Na+ symporter, NSS family [Natronorubrum sediminis]
MAQRETWATRTGFILAAVGSAVGLGNIWRFPFVTSEGGGAAFLLVYLLFIFLIGFPAILVEFVIGRRTKLNPVGALRELGSGVWKYVGYVFFVTAFVILSYYSVVAGWFVRYFIIGVTDGYDDAVGQYEGEAGDDTIPAELLFDSVATGLDSILFHTLFMLVTIGIVALGVRKGIELAVKVMVPSLIVLLVGLAIWAATLPGASDGYEYYLSPDFSEIAANWTTLLPAAAGQAFFTLSLGMGVMIVYASYVGEDRNLAKDGGIIIGFDTAIALLVGLIVFPILLTATPDPDGELLFASPIGAIFTAVADAMTEVPDVLGLLFFGVVAVAALSSAISILEFIVAYLMDEHGFERRPAALLAGGSVFALGVPVTYDLVFLELFDYFADSVLLVLGALLLVIFVGWVIPDAALDEVSKGVDDIGSAGAAWIWAVRIPLVVVLAITLALGIVDYVGFLTGDFADWISANL